MKSIALIFGLHALVLASCADDAMHSDAGVHSDAGRPPRDSGSSDAGLEDDELRMCQQRPIDFCEADGRCATIGAQRYDADGQCYGKYESAVCLSPTTKFNGAITCATAPDGSRWRFAEGTTLFGWKDAPSDAPCASVPDCS